MRPGNVTVVLPSRPWKKVDGCGKLQLAREIRAAVTPAELSDDDDVCAERVRREAALPELMTNSFSSSIEFVAAPASKVFVKARQHRLVLAVVLGFFSVSI